MSIYGSTGWQGRRGHRLCGACLSAAKKANAAFLIATAILVSMALVLIAQPPADESAGIKLQAKKYDFNPDVVRVKKGEHVKLIVTALDRDHGFKIEAFGVDEKLPKAKPVTIEFTADRSGTFEFRCSRFCGLGHKGMKGSLIVE